MLDKSSSEIFSHFSPARKLIEGMSINPPLRGGFAHLPQSICFITNVSAARI
jgi:hypothetical protein